MPIVVDRIVVRLDDQERTLSLDEFLRLPLSQRIRAILDRGVTFYGGGQEIARDVALDVLRRQSLA
jgi:hypothetical protein